MLMAHTAYSRPTETAECTKQCHFCAREEFHKHDVSLSVIRTAVFLSVPLQLIKATYSHWLRSYWLSSYLHTSVLHN